jgi:hypothetical protein
MKFGTKLWLILIREYIIPKLFAVHIEMHYFHVTQIPSSLDWRSPPFQLPCMALAHTQRGGHRQQWDSNNTPGSQLVGIREGFERPHAVQSYCTNILPVKSGGGGG